MEKYQDLEVHFKNNIGKDNIIQILTNQITSGGWKVRSDMSSRVQKNMIFPSADEKDIFCVESPKFKFEKQNIDGIIWMWINNNSLEVFNIISYSLSQLSCAQYNRILLRFEEKILKPIQVENGFKIIKTSQQYDIKDYIGEEGFRLLTLFSENANKSTGHSHPMDFSRWCEFIFYVHRNNCKLNPTEFQIWLKENGWDEDKSIELANDFEYSLELLSKYV